MGRKSNPDGGCHHMSVLPLGLPRPDTAPTLTNYVSRSTYCVLESAPAPVPPLITKSVT
ncbi:hypothetical protein F2Q70_00039746 [Brassica cretica]|uniref:Uncharacterized protein n=1 Tax=Brassica cretica TaxID=69181 RepID=A0A8S9K7S9_BRACR|nr:hypothetical protein F2Q70_00039746 [Brassica cretica]